MTSTDKINLFSLKYVAASVFATYCSGIMHPLDLIKTRYQSHDGKTGTSNLVPQYSGIKNALETIYKTQGFRGLYKGFWISLLCQGSSMGFFFWNYETRKNSYELRGDSTMNAVTKASIEASILTTLITQPIWVIKTRMLLNVNQGISQWDNFRRKVVEINHQHGLKGFLKGLQLSLVLSFSGVMQMYVYEGAKLLYDHFQIPVTPLDEKAFICGSLSKIGSVLLSYPITTMRTRLQQNQFVGDNCQAKYGGVGELFLRTVKEQGFRGFYKGLSANLMKGVGQKGIYFYFYEIFKDALFPATQEEL